MITIRPADNKDTKQLISLILPIQQQEFNVPITLKDQPDLQDIERFYINPGGKFWVAINENGEVLGSIGLLKTDSVTGVIRKMFVQADFRGRQFGIAQKLLEALVDYCFITGIRELYLGTQQILRAACKFYERNSFIQFEAGRLPVNFPKMDVDDTFYCRRLDWETGLAVNKISQEIDT